MSLVFLFIAAVVAASLLPLQSEAILLALLIDASYPAWLVIVVASVGNVFGACINWYLGGKIEHYKDKKWFPVSEKNMLKAQKIYQKYGFYCLFLSWMPIIGDPITLIAGLLKENFMRFLWIVSLAKFGRYLFIYIAFLMAV